ncbi:MAG: hypothetical protein ETSY2_53065 [Candidatus Entotheonella gemina]|uniref:Uncharacterized protein n=1 Tax=Candidatus Entotheonella gemina TaxID=1429439 RepID=W4L4J2_9BACT|nr:MAG: hypothetical protein ETSY2_53065 [Candidatus Entotheonella gemina]
MDLRKENQALLEDCEVVKAQFLKVEFVFLVSLNGRE